MAFGIFLPNRVTRVTQVFEKINSSNRVIGSRVIWNHYCEYQNNEFNAKIVDSKLRKSLGEKGKEGQDISSPRVVIQSVSQIWES